MRLDPITVSTTEWALGAFTTLNSLLQPSTWRLQQPGTTPSHPEQDHPPQGPVPLMRALGGFLPDALYKNLHARARFHGFGVRAQR